MKNIDQIIITSDPFQETSNEAFESYDITLGELLDLTNKYGDAYFMVGSSAAIFTNKDTNFTAVKTDEETWELGYELYDDYIILEHKGSLFEALDRIEKTDKDIDSMLFN